METLKELRERLDAAFRNLDDITEDSLVNFTLQYYDSETKEIITEKCENGVYTELSREKVSDDFDITEDGIQWDNFDQNEEISAKGVKGTLKRY